MSKKIFIYLILLIVQVLSYNVSFAQHQLDSLNNVWKNESLHDTIRLAALHKFAWDGFIYSNPDSAFYYANIEYEYAKSKNLLEQMRSGLNTMGVSKFFNEENEQALKYFNEAIEIAEKLNHKLGIASAKNNIGLVYKNKGEYDTSIKFYKESLDIYNSLNNEKGQRMTYNNIGTLYSLKGDLENALFYYEECLKMDKNSKDLRSVSIDLFNIGVIYRKKNELIKALSYFEESYQIKIDINDRRGLAQLYNSLGLLYFDQNDYVKSEEYLLLSLELYSDLKIRGGIADAYGNLGLIYLNKKEFDEALKYFELGLLLHKEIESKNSQAVSLKNIGEVYINLKNFNLALEYVLLSYQMRKEIGDKIGMASSLDLISEIYFEINQYDKAKQFAIESYEISEEIKINEVSKKISNTLSKIYLNENNLDSALYFIEKNRKLIEVEIANNYFFLTEYEKELYFKTFQYSFHTYFNFALNFQKQFPITVENSFDLAIRNKGLSLKSSTAMRIIILESGDENLIRNYEEWIQLKDLISKNLSNGEDYSDLEEKAHKLEKELVKNSNEFSEYDKIKNLSWKDVQNGLKNKEVAIEFIHFETDSDTNKIIQYAALLVDKKCKSPKMVKLCTETEIEEIIGVYQGNQLNYINDLYGTKKNAKTELYNLIWRPIENELKGVKNIFYSPSGILNKISFSALNKNENIYLCDMYDLHLLNTSGSLAFLNNTDFTLENNLMLMGGVNYDSDKTVKKVWDYLPGTLEEIQNINKLFEDKLEVDLYHGENSTEEIFKNKASNANIIHVASHGFFFPSPENIIKRFELVETSEDLNFRGTSNYANWSFVNNINPLMRSGIVLANANDVWERDPLAEGEDGVLTAQEVSNLDLRNTKLVVLSACETGLGDIKGSEGVYGLQRAFKMAGVEYIIMSLWQVPDKETAEFMIYFYTQLLKVKDIRMSFTKTQNYMRKKYDPYYWAAFVLIE